MKDNETIVLGIENSFAGIDVNSFNFNKFVVSVSPVVKTKRGKKIASDNFSIRIDCSSFPLVEHEKIKEGLKQIFEMSWTSYSNHDKTISYYTTGEYSGLLENNKKRLTKILEFLSAFEKGYVENINNNKVEIDKFVSECKFYKNTNFVLKFLPEKNVYVLCLMSYVSSNEFHKIAELSTVKGNYEVISGLYDIGDEKEFAPKKTYFIIDIENSLFLREIIERFIKNNSESEKEKESLYANLKDEIRSCFVEYKNPFSFRVGFDDDLKMIKFFCRGGYFTTNDFYSYDNNITFNALDYMASNLIMLKEKSENVIKDSGCDNLIKEDIKFNKKEMLIKENFNTSRVVGFSLDNKEQLVLKYKRNGVRGEVLVPIEDFDKIKVAYKNFKKVMRFLQSDVKKIVVTVAGKELYDLSRMLPSVFFHEDKAYLATSCSFKKLMEGRGLEYKISCYLLDKDGVDYFLNVCDLAEEIKSDSKLFAFEVYNKTISSDEEVDAFYNNLQMHYNLSVDLKSTQKTKKFKI